MIILFISLFALDAFQPDLTIWQQLKGFIIHLIPSFLLIIFLLFAWKKELYGGIIFIIIGIALTPVVYKNNYQMNESVGMSLGIIAVITIPFIERYLGVSNVRFGSVLTTPPNIKFLHNKL